MAILSGAFHLHLWESQDRNATWKARGALLEIGRAANGKNHWDQLDGSHFQPMVGLHKSV